MFFNKPKQKRKAAMFNCLYSNTQQEKLYFQFMLLRISLKYGNLDFMTIISFYPCQ